MLRLARSVLVRSFPPKASSVKMSRISPGPDAEHWLVPAEGPRVLIGSRNKSDGLTIPDAVTALIAGVRLYQWQPRLADPGRASLVPSDPWSNDVSAGPACW